MPNSDWAGRPVLSETTIQSKTARETDEVHRTSTHSKMEGRTLIGRFGEVLGFVRSRQKIVRLRQARSKEASLAGERCEWPSGRRAPEQGNELTTLDA